VVDPYSPIPAYRQVTESIRRRISAGRLSPGSVLLSAKDIAAEMGIGIATARRALRELALDGVIELVKGRLAVVRGVSDYERHSLPRKAVVRFRMPNPSERSEHQIPRGVPVAEVTMPDGRISLFIGDRDELTT
jgi:Predicted transcriptional regulators